MSIDFVPQFHQRISRGRGQEVWVAIPQPKALIPVKPVYYLAWQQEECLRLQKAGEEVLTFVVSR